MGSIRPEALSHRSPLYRLKHLPLPGSQHHSSGLLQAPSGSGCLPCFPVCVAGSEMRLPKLHTHSEFESTWAGYFRTAGSNPGVLSTAPEPVFLERSLSQRWLYPALIPAQSTQPVRDVCQPVLLDHRSVVQPDPGNTLPDQLQGQIPRLQHPRTRTATERMHFPAGMGSLQPGW
jgi:hypothetical protein